MFYFVIIYSIYDMYVMLSMYVQKKRIKVLVGRFVDLTRSPEKIISQNSKKIFIESLWCFQKQTSLLEMTICPAHNEIFRHTLAWLFRVTVGIYGKYTHILENNYKDSIHSSPLNKSH